MRYEKEIKQYWNSKRGRKNEEAQYNVEQGDKIVCNSNLDKTPASSQTAVPIDPTPIKSAQDKHSESQDSSKGRVLHLEESNRISSNSSNPPSSHEPLNSLKIETPEPTLAAISTQNTQALVASSKLAPTSMLHSKSIQESQPTTSLARDVDSIKANVSQNPHPNAQSNHVVIHPSNS